MYSNFQDECAYNNYVELWADAISGERSRETVKVTGDTYRHRATLRAMGGQWDKAAQAWAVPASKKDDARKLRGVCVVA